MGRLFLSVTGMNLVFGALAVLWLVSGYGRLVLTQAGLPAPSLPSPGVGFYFNLIFLLGFILLIGCLMESLAMHLMQTYVTGMDLSRERLRKLPAEGWGLPAKLCWGACAYLAVGLLYSVYLVSLPHSYGIPLERALPPDLVQPLLGWPYEVAVRLGIGGPTPSR